MLTIGINCPGISNTINASSPDCSSTAHIPQQPRLLYERRSTPHARYRYLAPQFQVRRPDRASRFGWLPLPSVCRARQVWRPWFAAHPPHRSRRAEFTHRASTCYSLPVYQCTSVRLLTFGVVTLSVDPLAFIPIARLLPVVPCFLPNGDIGFSGWIGFFGGAGASVGGGSGKTTCNCIGFFVRAGFGSKDATLGGGAGSGSGAGGGNSRGSDMVIFRAQDSV